MFLLFPAVSSVLMAEAAAQRLLLWVLKLSVCSI